jgi:hypothetical protein
MIWSTDDKHGNSVPIIRIFGDDIKGRGFRDCITIVNRLNHCHCRIYSGNPFFRML